MNRTQKCGDGTLESDGTTITKHFGGYAGSGLLSDTDKQTWMGIPTVFLTDSKMNNIDVKIPTNFKEIMSGNAEAYVEELQLAVANLK